MSIKLANKRVNDFELKYGNRALELACHAALPVAFNAELLHLLRINFFVDTSAEDLADDAEFQLLLSPLCREIDEDLYEIEPEIRDILFQKFQSDNGARLRDVASLLKQYVDRYTPWNDRVELQQAQKLTALNILDRSKSREWFKVNESHIGAGDRDWYVAMYKDIDRQNEIADFGIIKSAIENSSTHLDLSNQGLSTIPPEITKRTDLVYLDLSGNNIVEIPEAIGKLTNLTELWLGYNQITVIPEAIGKLTNLTKLSFRKNQITVIPEVVGKLTNLTELWLNYNQITVIPEAIGKLTNLTILDLGNNQIADIPNAIGKSTNLITLWLDDNQITVIPEAIRELSNLSGLYLSNNQITDIPQWFRSFKNLEKIDLRGNLLLIPPEILGGDLAAILKFYFQIQDPQATIRRGVTRDRDASALYPIWYGTNRQLIDPSDISRGFSSERANQVHYGCCQVAVTTSAPIGSTDSSWFRRFMTNKMTNNRLRLDRSSLQLLNELSFFESVHKALQERELGERSALVFIHGFNVTFESAAIQAAQIGCDLQVPIMAFYSWPSQGRLTGYLRDGDEIEYSEIYIKEFLLNLVQNSGIDKVHIIAHGMGNRGLLRAMQSILAQVEKISFGQIFLVAPDVNHDIFEHLAVACKHLADRTTLYVSAKDKALTASTYLHKTNPVGVYPPVRTYEGIDTIEVSNIDLSLLGRGYVFDEREVLRDMYELLKNNTPPNSRYGLIRSIIADRPYWRMK